MLYGRIVLNFVESDLAISNKGPHSQNFPSYTFFVPFYRKRCLGYIAIRRRHGRGKLQKTGDRKMTKGDRFQEALFKLPPLN